MYITKRKKSFWENYPRQFYPRTTQRSGHGGFYHFFRIVHSVVPTQALRLSLVLFSQRLFLDWPTFGARVFPILHIRIYSKMQRPSESRADPEMRHFIIRSIALHNTSETIRNVKFPTWLTCQPCTVLCNVWYTGSFSTHTGVRGDQQSNGTIRSRIVQDKYSRSL